MIFDQIRVAKEQAPFRPFTLFLSNQRQFQITHPDFLWLVPGGRTIALAHDSGAIEIVDLVHITSLKSGGNGAAGE